ncbi:GGDEF domain-containing response regulator [Chromobacterium alticapitis]|uniref:diguanylate cyclase n=1 Tax=Chromobacterium alticapitis TaxID=2073169 RepID=A0A2S5DEI9_9NEIS|nr:diguanylate cyclase [Chromobacterium alticapitis]POZ61474.1 diguanylate cyclase response regulator [Chromobacterium alticapitis]
MPTDGLSGADRKIVLCVDDDIAVLSALRNALSQHFHNELIVEIAESGEEALDLLEELRQEGRPLTIIVADYIMPGMKGDELLVRVHTSQPSAIKIMLTGQSDMQGVKRAINEANLFRFMEKPWLNEDLILTLQSAIRSYVLDQELRGYIDKLQRMNDELENIVQARTHELELKNEELNRLATTDRLTGLYNRLFLEKMLPHEFAVAKRFSSPFAFILLDIDHFKLVNDRHGHQVGDEVLKTMADIIRRTVRACDITVRWGGEEFLIICSDTHLRGARTLAEKLRQAVEGHDFPVVERCTASFGVAAYQESDDIHSMLERADQALYAAKHAGRNRVEG